MLKFFFSELCSFSIEFRFFFKYILMNNEIVMWPSIFMFAEWITLKVLALPSIGIVCYWKVVPGWQFGSFRLKFRMQPKFTRNHGIATTFWHQFTCMVCHFPKSDLFSLHKYVPFSDRLSVNMIIWYIDLPFPIKSFRYYEFKIPSLQ